MFQPGKTGTYHFRHLALSPPALGSPFRTMHLCTGKIENKSLVEKECSFRAQRATRKQVWHDITTVASKCSTNLVHHNFLLASFRINEFRALSRQKRSWDLNLSSLRDAAAAAGNAGFGSGT